MIGQIKIIPITKHIKPIRTIVLTSSIPSKRLTNNFIIKKDVRNHG